MKIEKEENVNFLLFLNSSEIFFPRIWSVFSGRGFGGRGRVFCFLELLSHYPAVLLIGGRGGAATEATEAIRKLFL